MLEIISKREKELHRRFAPRGLRSSRASLLAGFAPLLIYLSPPLTRSLRSPQGEKDNNFGDDSTISGSKPSGLLLQLVHEELGNFLKGNDFKALDEGLISERISEVRRCEERSYES